MKRKKSRTAEMLALAFAGMLAIGPAAAEKPSWAGGGAKADKGERTDRSGHRDDRSGHRDGERRDVGERSSHDGARHEDGRRAHFEERHREIVREHFSDHDRSGRCPPGLAKKHNGCMPPGQAKKQWQVGQPLSRDVIYHSVPQPLVENIGLPPAGHRYVRVASDILLIRSATGTVVDAIRNLGRS